MGLELDIIRKKLLDIIQNLKMKNNQDDKF